MVEPGADWVLLEIVMRSSLPVLSAAILQEVEVLVAVLVA